MKILTKLGLLSLSLVAVGCSKKQSLSVHNDSSKSFYIVNNEVINKGKTTIFNLLVEESLIEVDGKSTFSKISTGELLDKFKMDKNYVFYLVNGDDMAMPLVGLKAARLYDSIVVSVTNDITKVHLYVKDAAGDKLVLSSKVSSTEKL